MGLTPRSAIAVRLRTKLVQNLQPPLTGERQPT